MLARKSLSPIVISAFVLLLVFSYQNCSNVSLSLSVPPPEEPFKLNTKDSFCSLPELSSRDRLKILFVLDMSASNQSSQLVNGVEGSDVLKQRMNVIKNFMQQNCVQNASDVEVAVIGFADQTILPTQRPSCDTNQFKEASELANLVSFYESEDDRLRANCMSGTVGGICSTYSTNYQSGVDCARDIIQSDIGDSQTTNSEKSFYMTYFLTDGAPNAGTDTTQLRNSIKDARTSAETDALGMQFQPIFYGEDYIQRAQAAGIAVDREAAIDTLSSMADEGLSQYISIQNVNEIRLCDYLSSGTRIPYELKHFVVTNLTSVNRGGQLLADSDMDGIPDIDEAARNFDPTNSRTNGIILDGACGGLDAQTCTVSQTSACGIPNPMGVTQCDADRMSLTNGIDSNGDGLLDRLRLVKGLVPNSSSSFNEGDSMTEFQEILIGRDPLTPDDNSPNELLLKWNLNPFAEKPSSCPANQEYFEFSVDEFPLVATLANDQSNIINAQTPWLGHRKNENIIMVYYILTPANANLKTSIREQVYAKFLKVEYGTARITEDSGFIKIGELFDDFTDSLP
ncbi:MAG: hypothetical protein AB8E15_13660 [Bdellovibrionales bacterium]